MFEKHVIEASVVSPCSAARCVSAPAFDQLLVNLAIVPDPARRVTFARVAVCPMNHAPLGVPFVLAAERHNIAFAKPDDSRRQTDVVRDEKRLPRRERHDETLMPATVVVVREHPTNDALPFHLHMARVLLEGAGECLVAARKSSGRGRHGGRRAADTDGARETKDEMHVAHHDYVSEAIEPPNAGLQLRRAIPGPLNEIRLLPKQAIAPSAASACSAMRSKPKGILITCEIGIASFELSYLSSISELC